MLLVIASITTLAALGIGSAPGTIIWFERKALLFSRDTA